jgi:hypothetical protein
MMGQSYSVYTHFFPPKPTFTTKHIPNLNEKV